MNRIHIVGRKNSGKTTLIVELVDCLTRLGLKVGTIKHTHHNHELDTPGKDSFRHREAGAHAVGILSPKMNAIFWPQEKPDDSDFLRDDRYDRFQSLMHDCDLVLVEGDTSTSAIKVEVWRAENDTVPIFEHDSSIQAIVTDDKLPYDVSIFPRRDLSELVNWLLMSRLENYLPYLTK
jgi:molybdopterin-guanine dinucleotide biosynthesis protein B